ncbi:hypothetical protein FACS1894162_9060 [Bacteroidia bacterium]|nr:hypothetical protein FACS1894162_9060 [Bacteroidia bacterium]
MWFNNNLPETKDGKFVAYRFEVKNPVISEKIIINKNFYKELIGKHADDPRYVDKLEISQQAHVLLQEAFFVRLEEPIHHTEIEAFWVFQKEYNGFEIEFKVKKDQRGYFLYYMRIL